MTSKIPTVKLLSITPNAEALIEEAGCICYGSPPGRAQERIPIWIGMKHESMLEHASATFHITCSRVVSHELVRHRLASFSQRSQRYVDERMSDYYVPPELEEHALSNVPPEYREGLVSAIFRHTLDTAWACYRDLMAEGVPKQIARYVLPNAWLTQLIMTANFREWRHIIKLRASPRAQPEMQEVARAIRDILIAQAPSVFEDLQEN
jgi:thymidylate synthase (FAD)